MQTAIPRDVCSFCGTTGDERSRYASGFGALMCQACLEYFPSAVERASGHRVTRYDIATLTDEQMLEMLPRIAANAALVNRFMASWVEHIRQRKLSWTAIGNALGISRQAAWERFTRVLSSDRESSA